MPKSDRAIAAGGGKNFAVMREGNACDQIAVSRENLLLPTRRTVPQSNHRIGATRGKRLPARGERDRLNALRLRRKSHGFCAATAVPKYDRPLPICYGDGLASGENAIAETRAASRVSVRSSAPVSEFQRRTALSRPPDKSHRPSGE